jgi:protein gp37
MTNLDSKIEWTDTTWSPTVGCTKVSAGCDHCYAEGIARRFAGTKAFPNGFDLALHPQRLGDPLRWRKPRKVFVNSMSDLFHDDVPDEFIGGVFDVMAQTPQHTYQILTKRHGRMRSLLTKWAEEGARQEWAGPGTAVFRRHDLLWCGPVPWPLPNVWLGVSAEDQKHAHLRIPALLNTPAAVRFVSAEPLLGPIRLDPLWAHGTWGPGLDWVIVGGESGPGARAMNPAWAQDIVADCRDLGIAPFVKQLGSAYGPHKGGDMDTWPADLRIREYPGGGA